MCCLIKIIDSCNQEVTDSDQNQGDKEISGQFQAQNEHDDRRDTTQDIGLPDIIESIESLIFSIEHIHECFGQTDQHKGFYTPVLITTVRKCRDKRTCDNSEEAGQETRAHIFSRLILSPNIRDLEVTHSIECDLQISRTCGNRNGQISGRFIGIHANDQNRQHPLGEGIEECSYGIPQEVFLHEI